jgi:hypothetical protein
MKLSATGSTTPFEAHPEYDGQAVCVDVTPLKKTQSSFGEREVFRIVFENRADYRFFREDDQLIPSTQKPAGESDSQRGRGDMGGHSTPSHTCEINTEEKNETEKHLTPVHIAVGQTSPHVPTSPLPVFCSLRADLDRVAADLVQRQLRLPPDDN